MKKLPCLIAAGITLVLSLSLVACANIAINETDDAETYTYVGTEYEIDALKGTVHVPDGYGVSESANANEALIIPSGADSPTITIKVNDKIYDDVNFAEIKKGEAELYALNAVLGNGVADYDIVEGNGHRFFTFASKQDGSNVFSYATILDGHMVYVSANTGDEPISEELKADLESIAMSIQSEL